MPPHLVTKPADLKASARGKCRKTIVVAPRRKKKNRITKQVSFGQAPTQPAPHDDEDDDDDDDDAEAQLQQQQLQQQQEYQQQQPASGGIPRKRPAGTQPGGMQPAARQSRKSSAAKRRQLERQNPVGKIYKPRRAGNGSQRRPTRPGTRKFNLLRPN
jgi:hypothetical protein